METGNLKTLDGPELYTIAWIAALPIERAAAVAMLDEQHKQPNGFSPHKTDTNSYTWGRIGEHNIAIVSLAAGIYGLGSAAATASSLSSSLPDIRVGLLVGIGGGIARPDDDHDIRLGDVVVSQPDGTTGGVCQYDLVKAKPGDVRERKGFLAAPPRVLLNAIANIQAVHELRDSEIPRFLRDMLEANPKMAKKTKKSPSYTHQGFENDRLFHSSYEHVAGQDCRSCETAQEVERDERDTTDPEIHYGIIASGNTLVKDAIARDRIVADVGEDCLCFEMEAAGLMDHFPCLVIRGICDYADSHKNDRWQRYASATAAGYAKELLGYVPTAEIQQSKRALEILESVDEKLGITQQTTFAVKSTVDSMKLDSHGQKIRTWLAAPDPNTNANHARELRHDGTGAWLLEHTAFHNWFSGTHKHLWLHGMAGCGKTVLSTTILDYLAKDNSLVILSFFFDFSDTMKQKKNGMLRSLALQLHQGGHDSAGHLDNSMRAHEDGKKKPTTTTLEEMVRVILAAQAKVVILLDALDESTTTGEILLWLRTMFEDVGLSHVQIIYTSRGEAEFIRRIPDLIGEQCCLSLDMKAVDTDIRSYVIKRTQTDTEFTRKRLPESLLGQIQSKVGDGAKGMFRWAACQLDSLARCLSPKEIQKALNKLPTTLEETYNRMLQSIPTHHWSSSVRLLQFIVYAKRPLSLKEAVDIVATETEEDQPRFDVDGRVFDDIDILRHCPSLVSVIDVWGKAELHLAHFSVKEYLLRQSGFEQVKASINITKVCLAYLTDIEGETLAEEFPLARYAAEFWMDFAVTAEESEDVLTMIAAFLKQENTFRRWNSLHDPDQQWNDLQEPTLPQGSAFYYACIGGLTSTTSSMIEEGVDVNAQQGWHGSALQAASFHGHLEVVRLLLEKNAEPNMQCGLFVTALMAATRRGHLDVMRLLLSKNAEVDLDCGKYGIERSFRILRRPRSEPPIGTALQVASYSGHLDVVRLLLEYNATIRTQNGEHTAFCAAAERGHLKVVELLLDHDADIHLSECSKSALRLACGSGHIDVAHLLLRRGVNPQDHASWIGGAIEAVCGSRHFDLIQLLLNHVVDLHEQEEEMVAKTLRNLVFAEKVEIVGKLIDLGVDLNFSDQLWGSALQCACLSTHEHMARLLISHGADVNSKGGEYGSPLLSACMLGRREIVKILIDNGADVNSKSGKYGSPLLSACMLGRQEIVEILIDNGADVNSEGGKHGSPLECACALGHREIVEILINKGADVIAEGGRYGSPFYAACFGGDEHIVGIILDSGLHDSIPVKNYDKLLGEACQQDRPHVVDVLIACGVDLAHDRKIGEYLQAACCSGSKEVIKAFVAAGANLNAQCGSGESILLATFTHVCRDRDIRMFLIDLGAKFDTDNEFGSALRIAASEGNATLVERLLELGADVETLESRSTYLANALLAASWGHYRESYNDVVRILLNDGAQGSAVDAYGRTPLIAASSAGHADTVATLLQVSGILPNHQEIVRGRTVLSSAADKGHESVVDVLLTSPCINVNMTDRAGRTALHFASIGGHEGIVRLLLNHGISVDLPDRYGSTPLSLAARRGSVAVVTTLLAAGAAATYRDCFDRLPIYWAMQCGNTGVVLLLSSGKNRHEEAPLDAIESNIKIRTPILTGMFRHIDEGCTICLLQVDSYWYACSICCDGDFRICEECFASGGRCLQESHTLVLKKVVVSHRVRDDVGTSTTYFSPNLFYLSAFHRQE